MASYGQEPIQSLEAWAERHKGMITIQKFQIVF